MGSNPKGRGAEKTRKRLPAQRARREAPQRPPAKQADPLTAHQSKLRRSTKVGRLFLLTLHGVEPVGAQLLSQIESTLGIGKTVSTLLEFHLVCLHATLELFCILGRR